MPYPTIVGIDPSLSETGFVRIDGNRDHGQIIPSAPAGDAWAARYARLSGIAATLVDLTPPGSLVVIEAPAYSRVQGHVHDRSGLWWTLYRALVMQRQAVMYPVTVQHRMRYATGKGTAKKDEVLAAAIRRYHWADIRNNNVADAYLLADIGARLDGHSLVPSVPKACWPLPKLDPFPAAPEASPFADRPYV